MIVSYHGRAPTVASTLLLAGVALAGCLGGFSDDGDCGLPALVAAIQVIAPPVVHDLEEGSSGLEQNGTVAIRTGGEVTLRASAPQCPTGPQAYRWLVRQEGGSGRGGFEGYSVQTAAATVTLAFEHVGEHWVGVEFIAGGGRAVQTVVSPIQVEVFHVVEAPLPTDGSAFSTSFTAFCCPAANAIDTHPTGTGYVAVAWVKTISVSRTGEIIWSGEDQGLDAGPRYAAVLGEAWLEGFDVEVRPKDPITLPEGVQGEYDVEIRIGPRSNGPFETV